MLHSVVKISMMSAKYFEYYTIILRGPFFRGHTVYWTVATSSSIGSNLSNCFVEYAVVRHGRTVTNK